MSQPVQREHAIELAAEALLREHPDALVCGLSSNGLIAPIPQGVGLWGQAAIEGRAVIDKVVAADRGTVVDLWNEMDESGAGSRSVRLLSEPTSWATLHFLDLRAAHDILLAVILPGKGSAEGAELNGGSAGDEEPQAQPHAGPRFSTLIEDEQAKVVDCDQAFTEMFGYTLEEMVGKPVRQQIHPDDQARAVEGWLALLSTRRVQQTRLRRSRKDGGWVWVDTTLHNYLNQPDRNYVLVEMIDVSAEMEAQEALQEREELLRRLTEAIPDGLLQLDIHRSVVYHNARLLQILHSSPRVASEQNGAVPNGFRRLGRSFPEVRSLLGTLTPESWTEFDAALENVLVEGVDRDVEVDFAPPGEDPRRALMSLRALLRKNGEISGAITSVLDITDSARSRHELERRAMLDALTGCHNRPSILSALERELERSDGTTTGVVYVDIDNLKPVNDTLGHAAGDELLMLVAECLKAVIRPDDEVGRLGGDEFIVILPSINGPDAAMQVARRVGDRLDAQAELAAGTVQLRASVGVSCAVARTITVDELVKRADTAMYQSKNQGHGLPVLDAAWQRPSRPRD